MAITPCRDYGSVNLVVSEWVGRRNLTVLYWVLWITVAISTLTTRQHYLWDVITGLLLAIAWRRWMLRMHRNENADPASSTA